VQDLQLIKNFRRDVPAFALSQSDGQACDARINPQEAADRLQPELQDLGSQPVEGQIRSAPLGEQAHSAHQSSCGWS
jgi:hypothetical protein